MSYQPATYTGDGTQTNFAINFAYLKEEDVVVTVEGVETSFTFISESLVQISPAPDNGAFIKITRETDNDDLAVTWANVTSLTSLQLNTAIKQVFYLGQESSQVASDALTLGSGNTFDADTHKLVGLVDPENDQDAATKSYVDNQVEPFVTAASGHADDAETAKDAAESALASTQAVYDGFDDRYLGTKSSNPSTDNDGDALEQGTLYFNSSTKRMKIWNGSTWESAYVPSSDFLQVDNNLSDVSDPDTARANLSALDKSGDVMTGALNLADNALFRPLFSDVAEKVNNIGDIGGGTQDIDYTLGPVVLATVSTSTTTFTFSSPPANGRSGAFTLYLTNGGSQTVNWPSSVIWDDGNEPTLTASGLDALVFETHDGGTTWQGYVSALGMQSAS